MNIINLQELEQESNVIINQVCELEKVEYFIELEDEEKEQILDLRNITTDSGIKIDLNFDEVVFCKFFDFVDNLTNEQLKKCLFYSIEKSGMAFEMVD